ncbi:hypothetical protein ACO0LM_19525 [Undibacterium sp. Di26W]|uniref:hypothetical protein n=1 Tax=Undibacterium sp. Di26W TaxID=3413035 RepID=UPI003BF0462F
MKPLDVDADADYINWPSKCCRCGSKNFNMEVHTEKVVLWTVLSVTKYRYISVEIPVCGSCSSAHFKWYGAAIACAAIGWSGLQVFHKSDKFILFWWVLAIILAIIGTRKKPLKILGFNEDNNTIRLQIYNHAFASEMRKKNQ